MMRRNPRPHVPFRERMIRFFYGRNGSDALGNFLMILALILMVVGIFANLWWLDLILSLSALGLLIASYARMFSRNIVRRRRENAAFLRLLAPFRKGANLRKSKWRDRKTHIYKKCPQCKNTLRLPKEKGKHTVCCPCCHNRFQIKV